MPSMLLEKRMMKKLLWFQGFTRPRIQYLVPSKNPADKIVENDGIYCSILMKRVE